MSVHVANINSCFSVWHLKLVAFVEQEPILTGKQNDVKNQFFSSRSIGELVC